MMPEKRTAHTRLFIVKEMVRAGKAKATLTSYNGALALGFTTRQEMFDVVLALNTADFHKSMTAYHDHTCWHDVYRPSYNGQQIYLKLIVKDDVLIVLFKEQ